MRRPFLYMTIPMVIGIIFCYYIKVNMYIILPLIILSIIACLIGIRLGSSLGPGILVLFFLLGIFLMDFRAKDSQLLQYVDKPLEIQGLVVDKSYSSQEEGSYILLARKVEYEGRNEELREKVSLKVIGNRELDLGDQVIIRGSPREPLANSNPGLYNHSLHLLTQGIHTSITVKDYSIELLEGTSPSIGLRIKKGFTDRVEELFDQYLGEGNGLLMRAIVLGRSSHMDEDWVTSFRDLGLAHVLAVSGLHIGIIGGFLVILFAYSGLDRRINLLLLLSILWLYAYIIGNPPSVVRANIMFSLLLISRGKGEPYDSLNIIFFAFFLMVAINPFWVFSLGFQLSFGATFFIICLTPRIRGFFYPHKGRLIDAMAGILSVQIGLLPIQAYYFNRLPIMGLVSNILIIPLLSLALLLSMALLVFSFISSGIAASIAIIINLLLGLQFHILKLFNGLPILVLKLPSPSAAGILGYYMLIIILLYAMDLKRMEAYMVKAIVFYCFFLILVNSLLIHFDRSLEVDLIDVGQGDSMLLDSQEGAYLIDTGGSAFGNFNVGEGILLPYLEKRGIFNLKGVFISHYDGDHCGSLPYLMDNMDIGAIYLGYRGKENDLYRAIVEKAFDKDIPIYLLKKGDSLELAQGLGIMVLGPDKRLLSNSGLSDNDLSMVLLMDYYGQRFLFTGDIEAKGEECLLEGLSSPVDFIKVPHHGSGTSSSMELLDGTRPRAAFISVGRNNGFGHPSHEVVERYVDNGAQVYRTDELGLINIHLDEENYRISPFIKEELSIIYVVETYGLGIIYWIMLIMASYIMIRYFTLIAEELEKFELQGIY